MWYNVAAKFSSPTADFKIFSINQTWAIKFSLCYKLLKLWIYYKDGLYLL